MKKLIYGLLALIVVAGTVVYVGRDSYAQSIFNRESNQTERGANDAETILPAVTAPNNVIVEAMVAPARQANLSVATSGIVRDVLVAEGETVTAGAPLLQLDNTRQQAAVAQAEANLLNAQSKLAELEADPRPEEVARYQASVTSAQASLQKLYSDPTDAEIAVARSDLAKAEASLRQAQSDYDQVSWSNDISMMPQATALEKATSDYVATKARYDDLFAEPNVNDVSSAQAQLASAQADMDNFLAGSKNEAIAASKATVAASEAALQDAIAALNQTLLRAPFDGTVAAINAELGEQVSPGAGAVTLADFSWWRIETDDLTELSVVNVQPGDSVEISFDALPETMLTGRVTNIKPIGENKQGDITYTVLIELDEQDEQLRWNMTAEATIIRDDSGRSAPSPARQSPASIETTPGSPDEQASSLTSNISMTGNEKISLEPVENEANGVNGAELLFNVAEEGAKAVAQTGIVETSGANLNIRSGPGVDFEAIDQAAPGTILPVVAKSENGEWTLVQTGSGKLGWVSTTFLRIGDGAEIEATAPDSTAGSANSFLADSGSPLAAEALTPNAASQPLVFQSSNGGMIHVYDFTTGNYWPLTSGMDPAISPDGQRVAFVRSGGEHGLYIIDIDGGDERMIFNGGEGIRGPSWSPDGEQIVFSRYTGDYECRQVGSSICLPDNMFLEDYPLVGQPENTLSRVDANGGNFRDIPSLTTAIAPEWSDGGIVYQSSSGIQVTADTASPQDRAVINNAAYADPDWQANGGRIVFQSREGNHREIFTMNPDGSDVQALTRPLDLLAAEYPQNVSPAWSPDGEQIAFLSNRGEDNSAGEWAIWIMDADGGNQRPLPIALEFDYAFAGEQMLSW